MEGTLANLGLALKLRLVSVGVGFRGHKSPTVSTFAVLYSDRTFPISFGLAITKFRCSSIVFLFMSFPATVFRSFSYVFRARNLWVARPGRRQYCEMDWLRERLWGALFVHAPHPKATVISQRLAQPVSLWMSCAESVSHRANAAIAGIPRNPIYITRKRPARTQERILFAGPVANLSRQWFRYLGGETVWGVLGAVVWDTIWLMRFVTNITEESGRPFTAEIGVRQVKGSGGCGGVARAQFRGCGLTGSAPRVKRLCKSTTRVSLRLGRISHSIGSTSWRTAIPL